jgi:hypothetical protein
MRETTLFAAVVATLLLIGIGIWFGVRMFTATGALAGSATGALAGSADKAPAAMTGAKRPSTSPYDDYDIVVY